MYSKTMFNCADVHIKIIINLADVHTKIITYKLQTVGLGRAAIRNWKAVHANLLKWA